MSETWVYRFNQVADAEKAVGGDWEEVRGLLGGKGANLGEMSRLGVPVPPGFTITTRACNEYIANGGKFPEGLSDQITEARHAIETDTGKKFGDPNNPLLMSCRSGAKFSMPGMMDTVLNIGLNDDVVEGLAALSGDPRFAYDSYRRLVQMFGSVVLGYKDELFEQVLTEYRVKRGVTNDAELSVDDLKEIVARFRRIAKGFPDDPKEQLRLAVEAVFRSWNGKRAIDYRNAAGIAHDLGTAVNIQVMVFGNLGADSATGVAMSRDGATGEPHIEGDYLMNAQGEDVVAGTRATNDLPELGNELPKAFDELKDISNKLEQHYRDMQDMEFTVEQGRLWLLQTRDGKRTAQAAVRIAVDMAEEGLITRQEAVRRVAPEQVDFFLHPQLTGDSRQDAVAQGRLLGTGLNVSPGAAVGVVAFDPDLAERWREEGKDVLLVRPETKPDDVHGMIAAEGILTSRGGRTSHAALVARQFGKPAVVGMDGLEIEPDNHVMRVGILEISEGDWVSIDGNTGEVFHGKLDTFVPDLSDPSLVKLLGWADEFRDLGVRANADYPVDAKRARDYGAEGIGLCRTEHMFFEEERLPIVQAMIMASRPSERRDALDELLPLQRADFLGLFEAMDGLPVIIRLMDPPLHEFLPAWEKLVDEVADRKIRLRAADSLEALNESLSELEHAEKLVHAVERLRESNPMLGLRGVRLSVIYPEITRMQVRAIIEAACDAVDNGVTVKPEIMIPLSVDAGELAWVADILREEAAQVLAERGRDLDYRIGTMIETPRAAITAGALAETAEFFSFGTNDLTQTTFAISRDDAEASFLTNYISLGVLAENPFATLDDAGVGTLIKMAVNAGRSAREGIEVGICGEHGGEPKSIALCHSYGLDYVSCSPFRVPVARLAAAHAALAD
ncbi:MAG TPA: pyruvate, phosphate dikinase [Acidimicrobiia bacterium]|jgi:pyruvate,orthophosphate dikinase|nr:pyruvate, phosphate dikinase [Acidimicrobiia bacterium]